MMTCKKYKNLIEKFVEGTISNKQLSELKMHTETCESCREEFKRCVLLQDVVKQSLSSQTAAGQASSTVLSSLSSERNLRMQPVQHDSTFFTGRRVAIAAGIFLAVALLLGFALGRAGNPARTPLAARVPINIGKLEGIVLVRHKDSDIWQTLQAGSNVYLGDTFHSAAKSACVLKLDDKSILELNQNSMLVLKSYACPEPGRMNGQTQFFLEHGECTASLESPHGPFSISTPNGRVEALGTEFTVKVTDEQ